MDYTVEDLFNEVQVLLEAIQNSEKPIKITPDLLKDIEKLRKAVGVLKLANSEPPKQDEQPIPMTSSEKQLILRAQDLEKKALTMKLALSGSQSSKNQLKDIEKQVVGKDQMKQRRKLFKTIGGDKKWLPM